MVRADVLFLISEQPKAKGVFDQAECEKRRVFCVVKSVGMREMYEAKSHGLDPEYVFELSDYEEYQGEKFVEFRGVNYEIIRSYVNGQKIELTVTRRA